VMSVGFHRARHRSCSATTSRHSDSSRYGSKVSNPCIALHWIHMWGKLSPTDEEELDSANYDGDDFPSK